MCPQIWGHFSPEQYFNRHLYPCPVCLNIFFQVLLFLNFFHSPNPTNSNQASTSAILYLVSSGWPFLLTWCGRLNQKPQSCVPLQFSLIWGSCARRVPRLQTSILFLSPKKTELLPHLFRMKDEHQQQCLPSELIVLGFTILSWMAALRDIQN